MIEWLQRGKEGEGMDENAGEAAVDTETQVRSAKLQYHPLVPTARCKRQELP